MGQKVALLEEPRELGEVSGPLKTSHA